MKKEQYRFKTQLFSINGIHNIPGLVINSGYGYRFQTFCCKECGEIYVANLESLENKKFPLMSISEHENCPNCNSILKNSLVRYPENIFYQGRLLKNSETIDINHFEDTFVQEAYLLT